MEKKLLVLLKKLMEYENQLLVNVDDNGVLPGVLKIKYGYLYKMVGIPYIVVLEKYKCGILTNDKNSKQRTIKLFNIPIISWIK